MSAPAASPLPPRLLARFAAALCVLAVAAAVLSFVKGSWLGVIWVLLAGLASNMAWYYGRRARGARNAAKAEAGAGADTGTGPGAGTDTV
ncbi:hypothetical protein ACFPA8_02425 [Streptomyces ovatisporus]|uniref:Secreted protein n=1 Tax=Streptomyces ovatisporus TaxID=1128682 RepID=A0ABV9A1Q8_9ACTN